MTAASGGYLFIRRSLLLLLLYGCMSAVQCQTPTVTTRPEALVTSSGNVVEGSVIQVYCTVENNNDISFTWTLDGTTLLNDPAHIRIRTNIDGTDTTSVLTVDNFRDTDNGVYQCTATDTKSMAAGNGTAITLTAVDSTPDGTLMIASGPSDNEPVEVAVTLNDNRTGIALGGTVDGSLLTCIAGHQGDGVMNYSPPSVVWVRNGHPVEVTDSRITVTPTTMANGQLTSLLTITTFALSDAGVYQCVFTDSDGDTELITTVPYRLDTGDTVIIESVSPAVIILRPPEKLVIEVRTSGEYQVHFWIRNENLFGTSGNFQVMLPEEFPNFAEIFVRDNTTVDDLGIYSVRPTLANVNSQTHTILPDPDGVEFAVIAPEDANTTALTPTPVVILEGDSTDISCRSVGAPAPSITWELDNQIVSFEQTDTVTQFEVTLTGTVGGMRGVDVTPGNIISELHIVSARYPDHEGVYTCIGTNSDDLNVASSSASVTVQVQVIPAVEITAAFTRVNLGEDLNLTCSVIRGNPAIYNYSIVQIDTITTTTEPTRMLTGIQESDLGTYRCDVTNDAGTGSASITIELGVRPSVTAVQLGPVVVNTTVDLVCNVTAGDLPINIVWERDGGSEIVFMGNDTTGGNTTIMIGDGDYGTYTCTGSNRLGMGSDSIEVMRAVGPTLPEDQSVEVVTDTALILIVNITGFNLPLTNITWYIDGVQATNGTGNIMITNVNMDSPPATSTFVLDPVQFPIERGLYSVVATNDAGNDETTFNVTVTSPSAIDFPIENVSISVTESNDTSFVCSARGFPAPNFTWYRGNELVDNTATRLTITPSQLLDMATGLYEVTTELNISMADRTDAGMYRCVASNTVFGEIVEDSRVFDLTVNFSVTIHEEPMGDTVIAPTKVDLRCRADGVPTPTISWIKTLQNGSVFEYSMSSGNLNITEELDGLNQTSTLTIESTSALDTANYSCRAMNGFGQRESEQTEVIVFVGAQVDTPMGGQQFRVNVTEGFYMTCSASGLPSPSISFFRGNESLDEANGMSGMGMDFTSRAQVGDESMPVPMDDGTLLITRSLTLFNVVDEDSGNLTCIATNNITDLSVTRTDSVVFELIVQVAATITSPPANVSVVAPDSAMFSCTADSVPIPDITWMRIDNGTESEIISDNSTRINNSPINDRVLMSTLTLSETQPSTSAMYRCVASNLLGSENAVAQLTVNDLPEIIIPVENFSYTIDEGLTVTFVCSASGIPAPTITWFSLVGNMPTELNKTVDSRVSMSDLMITENYEPLDGRGTVFLVTSRLTLSRSNDSDSGTYSCQAENEFGNATREFELIVQVAPMIVTPPVDIIAVESIPGLYTFQCLAAGSPRPTITWLFMTELGAAENTVMDVENTTTITDMDIGDRQIMSNLSFSVLALSDAGMYICSAENDFRNSTVVTDAARLTVYVIPVITSVYPEVDQMSYTVDEGNSVIFECTATGIPAPEITWLKDGVELNSTSDSRITFGTASDPMDFSRDDGGTVLEVTRNLTLANTVDVDSGSYVCMATNMAGSGNNTFEVIVQVAPVITTPPLNGEVTEQESVLFICEATGRPRPTVTWYKADNSGLPRTVNVTDPRINIITQVEDGERGIMSNLTLDSVLPSDSATYVCSAENEVAVDGETRANASLTVNVVPVVVNQMNYTVDEGNSVIFECTATGIPAPEITWLRDGVELNSTSDPRITFGAASDPMDFSRDDGETVLEVTRNLTLANTVDEDSGSYVCMATNMVGNDNDTFEVIIQVAPVITTRPMNLLEAVEQESVLFICEATGRPRPRITWYKYDDSGLLTVIDVTDSRITVSEGEDGEREIMSNLTLDSVLPSDSATYVCSAENEVAVDGIVRENATLTVNVVPVVISVYPDGQLTYTVNEGNSVTFECTATGIPDPEITWRRNGMAFNSSDQRVTIGSMPSIMEVMRDSDNETVFEVTQTLTLNTTMDSDSGMYECVAMNDVGQDSSSFELIVQVAPTITQSPVDVTNTEGDVAVFMCIATGLPRPEFSWFFLESGSGNITQIFNSTQYTVSSKDESDDRGIMGTLMVLATVPSDTGVYRCVATNVVSMMSQNATLTVHVTPAIASVYPEVDQMNYTVNEGNFVIFGCVATGIPAPVITWLRDGVELNTTSDNRVMLDNVNNSINFVRMDDGEVISQVTRSLTLADAMDSDSAATYTCVASNAAMPGIVMMDFSLVVQVAPVIEFLQPEQQTIISPNDAVYNCRATAKPRPSITWYRVESNGNRTALTNTTKHLISVAVLPDRVISILQVTSTAPSDTADYVCEATNVVNTTEGSVSLTVHVRPEITSLVPGGRFVINQTNPVTFVCAATGIPAPIIQWYRGNMLLSGTDSRITINDTVFSMPFGDVASVGSSLSIDSTLGSDSGTYRCVATNNLINMNDMEIGIDEENVTLFVQVPPVVVPLDSDQRVIANESTSAVLSFRIDNAAPPVSTSNIRWFYSPNQPQTLFAEGNDFQEITDLMNRTNKSTLEFTNGFLSLTIGNIVQARPGNPETDTGRYFLEATNEAGVDSSYIDLVVFGEPLITDGPVDLFIINNGSSAVFTCGAQAFPEHNISWTFTNFNGTKETIISTVMTGSSSKYLIVDERNNSRFGELTVMNVEFGDRGVYTCSAANDVGTVMASANLTVHVVPVITETSGLTEMNINSPAVLVCLATGYPVPTISWRKDGEEVSIYDDNTLAARLDIIEFAPEYMDVNSTDGSGFQSSGYMGSGSVLGLLNMYTDTTVDQILGLGELGVVSLLSFEETVRGDTANYTCIATNALPETTTLMDVSGNIPLVILERPDSPVNVTAFNFGARWVALRWTPTFDGNRPVTSFTLYISSVDVSDNFTLIGSQNASDLMTSEGRFMYNISDMTVILPFTNYSFTVVSCNEIGCSDQSAPSAVIETAEDRPDAAPTLIDTFSPSSTSLYLSWTPSPVDLHRGILIGYQIVYRNLDVPGSNEMMSTTTDTSITLEGLGKFSNYSVSVSAGTIVGYGPEDVTTFRTLNDTSSFPLSIVLTLDSNVRSTITVTWLEPRMPNGIITHYNVHFTGSKSYNATFTHVNSSQSAVGELGSGSDFQTTLTDLFPGTVYEITVSAINGAGEGVSASETIATTSAPPVPPSVPPSVLPPDEQINQDPRTITIDVPNFSTAMGQISHYHIIVVFLPEGTNINDLSAPDEEFDSRGSLKNINLPCDNKPAGVSAYITAEMSNALYGDLNGKYVVGQDKDSDSNSPNDRPELYTNGPLCYSTRYTFFVRAYPVSTNAGMGRRAARQTTGPSRQYMEFSSSSYTGTPSTTPVAPVDPIPIAVAIIIIIIVLVVIVVVLVVVAVVVVRRRRVYVYKTTREDTDNNVHFNEGVKLTEYRPPDEGAVTRHPIPVTALSSHLERMHTNENCGFGEEYRIIQDNSPRKPVDICVSPENKPKNRYANIQCFDHTRVTLTPIEGAEHDYINANFIDGYNREREYIAAQGPLPDTLGDFWRMVWDYNITNIVMLTNLVEKMKIKCSQYWPNSNSQQYANIVVTIVNTVSHADFVIRYFHIKKVNSEEVREIRQFHFVSWPDFGVPRHATPLLHFLRRVRNVHPYKSEQPLLIHCSAGVGRTGTLTTIDVELQRAMQENVVDPFNFVIGMRQQRNHMVQTEAQYVYLHDAILEGVTSGATEVQVDRLGQKFAELEKVDAEGESGFLKEYSRLRQFKVNVKEFTDANDEANKFKNRLANALPYNYNRVHLQMSPGVGGSDYINASFVDGYAQKGTYIATQGPLANTVDDFWRMIWEKEVHVIVMLTQLEEKGKELCALYWPDSLNCPEKMGSLSIEVVNEQPFEDYILRELKVTDVTDTENKFRIIKQYHFTAWPSDGAPTSGAGMIDLIGQVTRTQLHTGNKPIVVHCSAGIGRTGAFCALSSSIERVKTEGIVDVFHCIKHLRTQRPHMVQSVEQYAFCYAAIREYVDSLNSYSNFQ